MGWPRLRFAFELDFGPPEPPESDSSDLVSDIERADVRSDYELSRRPVGFGMWEEDE